MRLKKIVLVLVLVLLLFGCNKKEKIDVHIENEINTEDTIKDNSDMKNMVYRKNEVNVIDNSKEIDNLGLRNSTIIKKYLDAVNLIKGFSENNSLELLFVEPIDDRISRMKDVGNRQNLLEDLKLAGAETVSYFTNEDILNIELNITEEDNSYSHIGYKASIANVNQNFNFKESKLYEFRNMLIETNDLDFNKLNNYVKGILNNKIETDTIFFNKIDDDRYETVRIENNNCYYKLIYNPKL